MLREQIITALREHEDELRQAGVMSVSLFGSVARGEETARDVDLAVRLSGDFSKRGLDYFGRFDELERRITAIVGREVDVIEEPARGMRFQAEIERDRAIAF